MVLQTYKKMHFVSQIKFHVYQKIKLMILNSEIGLITDDILHSWHVIFNLIMKRRPAEFMIKTMEPVETNKLIIMAEVWFQCLLSAGKNIWTMKWGKFWPLNHIAQKMKALHLQFRKPSSVCEFCTRAIWILFHEIKGTKRCQSCIKIN